MVPPKENTLRRPPAGMRTVSGRHSGDAHPVRMGAEGAKRGFSARISQAKGQSGVFLFRPDGRGSPPDLCDRLPVTFLFSRMKQEGYRHGS